MELIQYKADKGAKFCMVVFFDEKIIGCNYISLVSVN